MALGWDDAAIGGLMVADYVYHRWFDDRPKPQPAKEIQLPRADAGAPYAMLFGRCRVKTPVIAWTDKPLFEALPESGSPTYHYFLSMLLVLGIPFEDGAQQLLAMYAGDQKLADTNSLLPTLKGDGTDYPSTIAQVQLGIIGPTTAWPPSAFGSVEFLNGNSSQQLVQNVSPYAAYSYAGLHMTNATSPGANIEALYGTIDPHDVPGYRGFLSVFLYNHVPSGSDELNHWCIGDQASVAQYSYEIKTLPATFLGPANHVPLHDGDITRETGDCNPMDALYRILTGIRGMLGLDPGLVEVTTLQTAATTLYNEGNGYSRPFEGGATAGEMIRDIMAQVDGTIFVRPSTGKLEVKLIRNDYDVSSLDRIDPSNCESLQSFAAGGWTGVPTAVLLGFPDRAKDYTDGLSTTPIDANADADNGEQLKIQLRMEGVCEQANADRISSREAAARARPLMKCRAVVSRAFYQKVPGDCVKLSWPEWGITDVVFRIAAINRGTLESGKITLDLLQDYYFVWRASSPLPPVVGKPPVGFAPI